MLGVVSSTAAVSVARPRRASPAGSGVAGRAERLARLARVAGAAALLVFHVGLFWSHLSAGRLFEPAVALRWGIGLLLIGLLVGLRRVGVPLFRGRRALVVWLLVALLHVSAAMPATSGSLTADSPADSALSLVVLPPAAGLVLAAGLLLLGALLARAWRLVPAPSRRCREERAVGRRPLVLTSNLAPRAPPVPVTC